MFSKDDALTSAGLTESNSTFNAQFDDFIINNIGREAAGSGESWQLALNFKPADVTVRGPGQLRVTTGDSVLWALVTAGRPVVPLRLKGPPSARLNTAFTVFVLNGETRAPVPSVNVHANRGGGSWQTNDRGQATITLRAAGDYELRADSPGSYVRSNVLKVTVA